MSVSRSVAQVSWVKSCQSYSSRMVQSEGCMLLDPFRLGKSQVIGISHRAEAL